MSRIIDTGITEDDLRAALLAEAAPPTVQPGDWTVERLMREAKCKREKAARTLEKFVEEGRLVKLQGVLPSGKSGSIYRPVK